MISFCPHLERCLDGEQLVPGDGPVVGPVVEVAPLPHGGVAPALAQISLQYIIE